MLSAPDSTSPMSAETVLSCSVTRLPLATSARAASAERLMPSAITLTSPWILPISSWISRALFSEVSASVRTSSATTANPLPCWPARAASMAALRASRLVWSAMRATARTMSPMVAAWRSSSTMNFTEFAWRWAAVLIEATEVAIWLETLPTSDCSPATFSREVSAVVSASRFLAAITVTARCDCSEALAACSAPVAICSIALRSSSAAEEASVMPLASWAVAEATRSAAFCCLAWVRAFWRFSSARRPSLLSATSSPPRARPLGVPAAASAFFFTRAMSKLQAGLSEHTPGEPGRRGRPDTSRRVPVRGAEYVVQTGPPRLRRRVMGSGYLGGGKKITGDNLTLAPLTGH